MLAGAKTCSIFGQTGSGEARSLLEGVVAALIAHRVAPGETLTSGRAVTALWCRNLLEGAALEHTVRHMRLQPFAMACSLLKTLVALVVLGVVLLRSVPMYPALDMCVCCGGVRLYLSCGSRSLLYI